MLFITTCTAGRRHLLNQTEVKEILEGVRRKSAEVDGWFVGHYVLMPDHVHFFAKPSPMAKPIADWMKTWKSVSSRRIASELRVEPPIWQADYFDHFVRSVAAYAQKWGYVQQNPVRRGLCRLPEDWTLRGTLHELHFSR